MMIDAQCSKCGKRYGWQGEVADQPPCPRCGHKPDPAKLAADHALIRESIALLKTHPKDATPAQLARMRVLAGLTLMQAARQLQKSPTLLEAIEEGSTPIADCQELAAKMAEVYGCGRG